MIIRKSYPTDAYEIINVYLNSIKEEYKNTILSNITNNITKNIDNKVKHIKDQIEENNRILVATEEDKIIGFIFYAKSTKEEYTNFGEIRYLYILKEYQRKGIGSQLFKQATKELKKIGLTTILLYCPVINKNNNFFIKMGGSIKEITQIEIEDISVNCNSFIFKTTTNNSLNTLHLGELYTKLVDINLGITGKRGNLALIEVEDGDIYFGLNIFENTSELKVAISNMKMYNDTLIKNILIINNNNELVPPNNTDKEMLISMGYENASVLIDITTLTIKKVKEL